MVPTIGPPPLARFDPLPVTVGPKMPRPRALPDLLAMVVLLLELGGASTRSSNS